MGGAIDTNVHTTTVLVEGRKLNPEVETFGPGGTKRKCRPYITETEIRHKETPATRGILWYGNRPENE